VNQRNYKTLAMQAHTLTRKRYFYSLNAIISHPIVYKKGLGYLSICAIVSRSSRPSYVRICNGHPSSELCCVHCTYKFCMKHYYSMTWRRCETLRLYPTNLTLTKPVLNKFFPEIKIGILVPPPPLQTTTIKTTM
jgi:hypothetical protein